MARYTVTIRTPLDAAEAFAFMADLNNFALWDPGVRSVRQVEGDGAGADSVYDVEVAIGPTTSTLRYETTEYHPPDTVTVVADNGLLRSVDTVEVRAVTGGCTVTYDAELTLRGPLGLLDPVLRHVFDRVGDRAAAGLVRALDGARLPQSA